MTIENKVVAVTGAGRGIGRATALRLAGRGASLVLGSRNEAELAELAGEIERAGGRAVFRVTDVTQRSDLEALVALACERFDRLDVRRDERRQAVDEVAALEASLEAVRAVALAKAGGSGTTKRRFYRADD